MNTYYKPEHTDLTWKVLQHTDLGYLCQCVEYPDVLHTFKLIRKSCLHSEV